MAKPILDAKKTNKIPSKNKKKTKKDGWKEVLKDDADFDYEHILIILCYKLRRTRECIVSNDIVMDAKKIANEIREVEDLLRKVIKDKYFDEITKDFRKKYGNLRWKTVKHEDDEGKFSEMRFYFAKETPETRGSIFKTWYGYHEKAEKDRKADLKRAFDLMAEKIWSWWD